MKVRLVALALLAAVGGLVACSKPAATTTAGTCLSALTTPGPTPTVDGPAGAPLPNQAIDCLDSSGAVKLSAVTVPMVVNLWATSCAACKEELPAMEAFHRAAAGKVAVVGVDNLDPRSFGTSYVAGNGLTYPMLYDPSSKLAAALGRHVLPLTLFVRPGGQLAYVYLSTQPLDIRKIADLAERYLGVQVAI